MEIGLYQLKYPFRKLINFLLVHFQNTNPNYVSLLLLPIGLLTALLYLLAPHASYLYWVAILLIFVRMIVGTLDGLIAETYHKETPNGSILNRLAPEAADWMLMLALIFATPGYYILGIFSLIICWAISYTGLIGLAGGKASSSVGPAGQTDRLVALMLLSALQFFNWHYHWNFDFIKLFFWWVIIGGIVTIGLRCYKTLK